MTKQRKEVYRALMENQDHPSASELFDYMQNSEHPMSLATVYNCLEALVEHGAVKQVNVDREPTRYCQNSTPHGHFHDHHTDTFMIRPQGRSMTSALKKELNSQISWTFLKAQKFPI